MQTLNRFPKVLVVTPSFNQGAFIRDTIESVLLQDYPNLEYIVVDGGSTDETLDILREHDHDSRFKWISESDEGQADAIHKGFMLGSGEIYAWLCSDDFYLPGAISTTVRAMQETDADFLFGNVLLVNESAEFIRYFVHPRFHRNQFRIRMGIYQPACFWTRSLYEKVGGLDKSLQFTLDRELFWRMSRQTTFTHINTFLSAVRLHEETKTAQLFGTVQRNESQQIERRMRKGIPLFFPQYFSGFSRFPTWLQILLRAMFALYNTPLRLIYAPRYVSSRIALNVWCYFKSLPHRGKTLSELINSLPGYQDQT